MTRKTLKNSPTLIDNLVLVFRVVTGCMLTSTFDDANVLVESLVTLISRCYDSGNVPPEMYTVFNRVSACPSDGERR